MFATGNKAIDAQRNKEADAFLASLSEERLFQGIEKAEAEIELEDAILHADLDPYNPVNSSQVDCTRKGFLYLRQLTELRIKQYISSRNDCINELARRGIQIPERQLTKGA